MCKSTISLIFQVQRVFFFAQSLVIEFFHFQKLFIKKLNHGVFGARAWQLPILSKYQRERKEECLKVLKAAATSIERQQQQVKTEADQWAVGVDYSVC